MITYGCEACKYCHERAQEGWADYFERNFLMYKEEINRRAMPTNTAINLLLFIIHVATIFGKSAVIILIIGSEI